MNINMKKKLIVTSLLAASVFASAANAAAINITGTISSSPCAATVDTIKMPNINLNSLGTKVGVTNDASAKDITIKLTGCPAMQQTAKVTFTGTADKVNKKALELTGVEGVALALFEKDGTTAIDIGATAADQTLTGSQTKDLEYKVKYVTTATTFKPGDAKGVLNYTIAYN
ncbi:putative fimbrial protein [Yersinia mollaretii]|uniref:fimbrial protein n=1 Tax=Yersinia mollaretii TaxID=33060 RepID=UPI0005E9A36F|nr:fimbrial protein [Yersinia mollaretii]CNK59688.1 putative fimbrial protein [Yersinia mollaretii]